MPKRPSPHSNYNVALSQTNIQHAALGAALHSMTVNDYMNEVVATWIVAANAVLLSQPPREGTLLSQVFNPKR